MGGGGDGRKAGGGGGATGDRGKVRGKGKSHPPRLASYEAIPRNQDRPVLPCSIPGPNPMPHGAGQEEAKRLIQEVIVWPMLNPTIFQARVCLCVGGGLGEGEGKAWEVVATHRARCGTCRGTRAMRAALHEVRRARWPMRSECAARPCSPPTPPRSPGAAPGRARAAKGRAAVWPAGHGQDAAGPGRGGKHQGRLLCHLRIHPNQQVDRRGRKAGEPLGAGLGSCLDVSGAGLGSRRDVSGAGLRLPDVRGAGLPLALSHAHAPRSGRCLRWRAGCPPASSSSTRWTPSCRRVVPRASTRPAGA